VSKEIVDAVKALEQEKGISADKLMDALEDALLSAYKKTPGAAKYARVDLDHETGDFRVFELILPPELEEKLLAEAAELQEEPEVDPETGQVQIVSYSVLDDFGRVINPMLVAGQVHGGVVQGLGQALMENCVYDPESGQAVVLRPADWADAYARTVRTAVDEWRAACRRRGIAYERVTTDTPFGLALRQALVRSTGLA